MQSNQLSQASKQFIATNISEGFIFKDVISVKDVAKYAILCALASYSSFELKSELLELPSADKLLELETSLKLIASDCCAMKFSKAIKAMSECEDLLALDFYFGHHMSKTVKSFRESCFVQYFSPYSTLSLVKMASDFSQSVESLEKTLADLINRHVLEARIDSKNKTLNARQSGVRQQVFQHALEVGDSISYNVRAMTMRLLHQKHRLTIKTPQDEKSVQSSKKSGRQFDPYGLDGRHDPRFGKGLMYSNFFK